MLGYNMVLPIPFILELLIAACEVKDAEEWKSVGLTWFSSGDVLLNGAKLGFMGIDIKFLSVGPVSCP
jgi:hypothetical protein